jgi:DNA-binding NtrC family response regulator
MTPPHPAPRAPRDPAAAPAEPGTGQPPEIAVFGSDPELLRQLRIAGPAMSIVAARNAGTLINLLRAGHCAALVIDAGAVGPGAAIAVMRLYQHFPSLPVIAVGKREDELRLGHLISAGRIYRFLHRPLSAARTRHFLEAALRRHAELQLRHPEAPAAADTASGSQAALRRIPARHALVAGVLLVIASCALWWLWPASPAHATASVSATRSVPPRMP